MEDTGTIQLIPDNQIQFYFFIQSFLNDFTPFNIIHFKLCMTF